MASKLADLISRAERKELEGYLLELAERNNDLAFEMMERFSLSVDGIRELDPTWCVKAFEDLDARFPSMDSLSLKAGKCYLRNLSKEMEKVLPMMIDSGLFTDAFKLLCQIFQRIYDRKVFYQEEVYSDVEDFLEAACNLLDRVLSGMDGESREECLRILYGKTLDDWGGGLVPLMLIDFISRATSDTSLLEAIDEDSGAVLSPLEDDWYYRPREYEYLVKASLRAAARLGKSPMTIMGGMPWLYLDFSFAEIAMDALERSGAYDELIKFLIHWIDAFSDEDSAYRKSDDLSERLADTYMLLGRKEEALRILEGISVRRGHWIDRTIVKKIKAIVPEAEWRDTAIALSYECCGKDGLFFLAEEGIWDVLLSRLAEDPDPELLMKWEEELIRTDENRFVEALKDGLVKEVLKSKSRAKYEENVPKLFELRKYRGGERLIASALKELTDIARNRPALMDVLWVYGF